MASIEVLANMGEDALTNHFQFVMSDVSQLGANVSSINMRTLTCDIPERVIGTYEITKRGRKMTRPSGVEEQTNEITFSFRADKYWKCYNSFVNWMNFVQDNETMAMASDSGALGIGGKSEYRANFEIWSITNLNNEVGVPNNIWVCEGFYPISVSGVSFDEESGDPLIVEVTLQGIKIKYPKA